MTSEELRLERIERQRKRNRWNFKAEYYTTLLFIEGLYLILVIASAHLVHLLDPPTILIVVLASIRLTRAVVGDKVFDWLHDLFHHAGLQEVSEMGLKPYDGVNHALHVLISCPRCFGTWAVLIVANLIRFDIGFALVVFLALAACIEAINYGFDAIRDWRR